MLLSIVARKMVSLRPLLQKRHFCSLGPSKDLHNYRIRSRNCAQEWSVKQVMKFNFSDSLEELKDHISISDFVSVSMRKSGSITSPWHRVSPFDTADMAYFKAKYAAERFQILQFAVCPFSIRANKLIAHPYNFHLFPGDELKIGMPSYSFSCQSSCLTSMANEGFDFNACIYDGISYISRAQEAAANIRTANPQLVSQMIKSSLAPSVADNVFIGRIKSRVKHWIDDCKSKSERYADPLVNSLRSLLLGGEQYESRPCMTIDICSERQLQLVLEMLLEFSDELVPLITPVKGGGAQSVRVVLTSSKEDKDLLESKLQNFEEEQKRKVCGFREVIDLISASQKPIVSHNFFNDFTFIHSHFLAPLPSNMDEFMSSLRLVFSHVLDVSHLMKEVGIEKVTSIPAAISYLKGRFTEPIDLEIQRQDVSDEAKMHGIDAVWICHLFAKLCSILKIDAKSIKPSNMHLTSPLESYANISNPFANTTEEAMDENIRLWTKSRRKTSSKNLVFLWGFGGKMITAGMLKTKLQECHEVFSEEFNVRFVDKSCAIVVFWKNGLAENFLNVMRSSEFHGPLKEMVSEGLQATGYETYTKACRMCLGEADLANSLEKTLENTDLAETDSKLNSPEIEWSELIVNFDEL